MKVTSQAPAKIILSGEHSVVYGAPGLSMAVDLPTTCEIEFTPNESPFIEIELVNYKQKHAFPFKVWLKLALNIEARYQLYEREVSSIKTVLQQPVDLVLDTLYHFNHFHRLTPGHWSIKIESHPYPSRGLGSSAAVILSLLTGLYQQQELTHYDDEILVLAQLVESRQHGVSSGIDPTTIFNGGLLKYQQQKPVVKVESHQFTAWLIDTGVPKASTGQSVETVGRKFNYRSPAWPLFAQTTEQITQAWENQNTAELLKLIKQNQALLEKIGVVPEKVQRFVKQLNQTTDVAAKLCGAGSVTGDEAGMLLCISPHAPQELCEEFGYELIPLSLNTQGVHYEMAD